MNILFEDFPCTVTVHGKEYEIVTDFREWIKLHELLRTTTRFTRGVLNTILDWYMDERPEDEVAAVKALDDFMKPGIIYKKLDEDDPEQEERPQNNADEAFSFEQDMICIYCDFFQSYGIDIESISYMHWWKFLVLLYGLPGDAEIKQRMYYRTVDLNKIENKEDRKRIKEIRKQIKIKNPHPRRLDDYEIGAMF